MQRSLGILALTAALTGGLVLGSFGSPNKAQAQECSSSAPDPIGRARELYGRGQQHFEAGRYQQAQICFEAAASQVDNPPAAVLLAIAHAQERRGLVQDAIGTYERYLSASPNAPDRAEIEEQLERLRHFPAMVTIRSTPGGAGIALDGTDTGRTTPSEIQIPGGAHRITFSLNGHETTQDVEIEPATHPTIEADLSAFVAPAGGGEQSGGGDPLGQQGGGEQSGGEQSGGEQGGDEGGGDVSPAVWATAGVAVAGLIAGTVCGFLALSEQDNYNAMPTAEVADRGETFALVADISFGVAGAGAIAALIIFLADSAGGGGEDQAEDAQGGEEASLGALPEPELTLTPLVGPNGGGLGARLRF